jgi:hypothetical protein
MSFNPVYTALGDNKRDVYGATEVGMWTITFGAGDTYVTGGLALVAATFGLSRPIAGINVMAINTAALTVGVGDNVIWNSQTQKLQFEGAGGGAAGTVGVAELNNGVSIANAALTLQIICLR